MARIDHAIISGTFSLDGQTFDVDNNVWVVGNDTECVVIDAPHAVDDIMQVVGDRTVLAVLCSHAHDDHVRRAPDLGQAVGAPVLLHPADLPVWHLTDNSRHGRGHDGLVERGQKHPGDQSTEDQPHPTLSQNHGGVPV